MSMVMLVVMNAVPVFIMVVGAVIYGRVIVVVMMVFNTVAMLIVGVGAVVCMIVMIMFSLFYGFVVILFRFEGTHIQNQPQIHLSVLSMQNGSIGFQLSYLTLQLLEFFWTDTVGLIQQNDVGVADLVGSRIGIEEV
jgi:hypothetical protein